ncbi:MAG: hypothetical protein ACK43N_11480, partial [Pirellulaceae bacterium]
MADQLRASPLQFPVATRQPWEARFVHALEDPASASVVVGWLSLYPPFLLDPEGSGEEIRLVQQLIYCSHGP